MDEGADDKQQDAWALAALSVISHLREDQMAAEGLSEMRPVHVVATVQHRETTAALETIASRSKTPIMIDTLDLEEIAAGVLVQVQGVAHKRSDTEDVCCNSRSHHFVIQLLECMALNATHNEWRVLISTRLQPSQLSGPCSSNYFLPQMAASYTSGKQTGTFHVAWREKV